MSSLDQDKASELTQEITESTVTPEISATATEEQTTPITPVLRAYTKPELIAALKELVAKEVDQVKDDVENIKQLFYKKHKIELEE